MTQYYLNKNVYVVNGSAKHCIYDLEREKLYAIDQSALQCINTLLQPFDESQVDKKLLEQLLEAEIITNVPSNNDSVLEVPAINFAWIEITKACNLKCIHCYNEAESIDQDRNSKMTLSDFYKAIDSLLDMGIKNIQLIGGEPYTYGGDFDKLLSYICGKFQFIEIFTNGTKITESDIEMLKTYKISQVALSIYSDNPAEHDRVTKVKGSYEKTRNIIRLLEKNKISYRLANVMMNGISSGNISAEFNTQNIKRDYVRLSGRGNLNLYDDKLLLNKLITKSSLRRKINRETVLHNMNFHKCFSKKIYIDKDLNVYPCVMERRVSHGNIKEHSLKDLINEQIIRYTKDHVTTCRDCEYRYACSDCRPDSIAEDFDAKPWYCTYDPYLGEWNDTTEFIKLLKSKGREA